MTAPRNTITGSTIQTYGRSALLLKSFIDNAEEFREALTDGAVLEASIPGMVVAEIEIVDGNFVMCRRDDNDAEVTHSLAVDFTDAERLVAHWTEFCNRAVLDIETRDSLWKSADVGDVVWFGNPETTYEIVSRVPGSNPYLGDVFHLRATCSGTHYGPFYRPRFGGIVKDEVADG